MKNQLPETCDVAVIGAGPSGSAVAMELARAGLSVVVFEQRQSFHRRLGESLPPVANKVLLDLQVWQDFMDLGPLSSSCNASAWGDPNLVFNDFIFGVEGPGWHIDRGRFDAMLAHAAQKAGAIVILGATINGSSQFNRQSRLDFVLREEKRSIFANFLIDASGRSNRGYRRPGFGRNLHDCLIGAGVYMSSESRASSTYTLVEAIDDGWFYTAQPSANELVVCYMTDADLYAAGARAQTDYWSHQLRKTVFTKERILGFKVSSALFLAAANSSFRARASGENWIAVGDALMSYDPLSSSGILTALQSGRKAAQAVLRSRAGDTQILDSWMSTMKDQFISYLATRRQFYSDEKRWPKSTFWRRRQ